MGGVQYIIHEWITMHPLRELVIESRKNPEQAPQIAF